MITLITGGIGSGKTAMAMRLASAYPKKLYIATAEPIDSEMKEKISKHRAERDSTYTTLEAPLKLPDAIISGSAGADVILVDCLTVWVSNLLYYSADFNVAFTELYNALGDAEKDIILVTNEVCMGLIGIESESRKYQKELSWLNKHIAAKAGRVCLMVSGIPVWIKEEVL